MENCDSGFDIAIVGAGIAGSALAAYLAKSNLKILLIEKDWSEQERIVGELLQPGGVQILNQMELSYCLEGFDAQPVYGYAIFKQNENFTITYPKIKGEENIFGRGFKNGKFLQRLRAAALSNPKVFSVEGEAKELIIEGDTVRGVKVILKRDNSPVNYYAKLTVICDGIFSGFRNQLCSAEKKVSGFFLGIILKECQLPFPFHGHVFTGGKTPFLAYPISSTEIRMLIDFPGEQAPRRGPELNNFLMQEVYSQLPETLKEPFIKALSEGHIKNMPNHYLPAKPLRKNGVVMLGDSLNMRHPLTGGGMTVALTDTKLLGDLLMRLDTESKMHEPYINKFIELYYQTRPERDATINILANALYQVFSHQALRDACFYYLKQGGIYAEQPLALLSAISRNRKLLLKHFFAVAAFGAKQNFTGNPSLSSLKQSYTMIGDAVKIVHPLLNNENPNNIERLALWVGRKVFA